MKMINNYNGTFDFSFHNLFACAPTILTSPEFLLVLFIVCYQRIKLKYYLSIIFVKAK